MKYNVTVCQTVTMRRRGENVENGYDLDEILAEVKKRREAEFSRIKGEENLTVEITKPEEPSEPAFSEAEEGVELYSDEEYDEPFEHEEEIEFSIDGASEEIFSAPDNISIELPEEDLYPREESGPEDMEFEDVYSNEETEDDNSSDENEMVDLYSVSSDEKSDSEQEYPEESASPKFFQTKKGKIVRNVIIAVLVVAVGLGSAGGWYLWNTLGNVTNDAEDYKKEETYHGMDLLDENFPTIQEDGAADIYGYKDMLKKWYKNGDPVSSTHVINVLLIGEDTRTEEISENSRADASMIVSVNVDTGKITVTSVLRDLYCYYEINGKEYYAKINSPSMYGSMKDYIKTVEQYYKIQIDNYVIVNFATFPKIIDKLGGVTIDITQAEINEIANHQKRYNYTSMSGVTAGKSKLNGEQALAYCRIRYIDSDNKRADRQKTVMLKLFEKARKASTSEAVSTITTLMKYVKTGYSKSELISIAKYALSEGWLDYEIETFTVPTKENSQSDKAHYGAWVWKTDFPEDAYNLQMKIYGKSNIELAENRVDFKNIW